MAMYTAVIQKEGKMYVVRCPEVGTTSQGKTVEEALKNIKEATELYLEEFSVKHVSHPIVTTFEVAGDAKS
ncbi:MAG: type II toxin-antitoxin system HicB family antitoxin [archaeon]